MDNKVVRVDSTKKGSCRKSLGRNVRSSVLSLGGLVWLSLTVLPSGFPALAQSQQPPVVPGAESGRPDARGTGASAGDQRPDQRLSGSISGTVVDPSGAIIAGARVRLTREDQSPSQEVLTGDDGQFSFT